MSDLAAMLFSHLSHAMGLNKVCDRLRLNSAMLARFGVTPPARTGKGLLRRFRIKIHAVDLTVVQLAANCMDRAKHRRRKAAAKTHPRLDLHSFLPSFAIVDTAGQHDNKRAREICAIAKGEIVVFDKAYVDFDHLFDLAARCPRTKDSMQYRIVKNLIKAYGNISWTRSSP